MGSSTVTSPEPAATATLPDAWRVELFRAERTADPDGRHLLETAKELGIESLESARMGRGFLLPPGLPRETVEKIVRELLRDPVLDEARLFSPRELPPGRDSRRILVARKPGVMDPVALTVEGCLRRSGLVDAGSPLLISTFTAWELDGPLSDEEVKKIALAGLANDTIEDVVMDSELLFYGVPASGVSHVRVEVPLREAEDETLLRISEDGALSLNLEEMREIQAHFRNEEREPTACELETLAQTWSEHCKHKTFAGAVDFESGDHERRHFDNLLKETIKHATVELDRDWCISVFHDNAGIIEFDAGWDVCFKVETHNHPSAIDPYGGAGTGIGGVIRDILGVGLGAKPIANTDSFFVGPSELEDEELPRGCMHPRRILRGVVAGVRDYGNRMGIPTVNGGVWFDRGYVANPLVFAGTVGIIPRECATKSVNPGDIILLVGGRTGRDGIHGATFSSVELHEESEMVSSAAVQIGDPITEKKVLDTLLQARDAKLYRAITDCGAGGLSSAVGEMGEKCGAEVELSTVPLKYPGLTPEEIWISEAQERMVLAVPPENLEACVAVFEAEDVEATAVGTFTDSGRLILRYGGEEVCDISMAFLHDGTPKPRRQARWNPPKIKSPGVPAAKDVAGTLLALLSSPNVASKEWIIRQYDHEVQGAGVLRPTVGVNDDGPGDGAVLRPLEDSFKGIAITCGANPNYGRLHPGRMAAAVIDEALRNAVAVGGDPSRTAILDNFSWGNCDKPDRLGALVLAAEGCRDAALAYETPFISGKDSLNNEYRVGENSISIPPTLLISALSIVPDIRHVVSADFKEAGGLLYQVGLTRAEFGGSEYFTLLGEEGGVVPTPDLATAPALLRKLHGAIAAGLVRSCHDLSEGGLAVAAAESSFAGRLGADLDLGRVPCEELPDDCDSNTTALFSESTTRFLVEIAPGHQGAFEAKLGEHPFALIGRVRADRTFEIRGAAGDLLASLDSDDLAAAHQSSFQG
jgi:phosphoribosylformylglycinamidine synthase subunit PurSL